MNNLLNQKALGLVCKQAKCIASLKTEHQFEKPQSINTEIFKDKASL